MHSMPFVAWVHSAPLPRVKTRAPHTLNVTRRLPEFLREGFLFVTGKNEGKAEGIELGRSESLVALRNVLIDILAARGIALEDSVRARIEQCRDVATLARWCTRASSFTEGSLDEQLV
jgi:hypothetical protein